MENGPAGKCNEPRRAFRQPETHNRRQDTDGEHQPAGGMVSIGPLQILWLDHPLSGCFFGNLQFGLQPGKLALVRRVRFCGRRHLLREVQQPRKLRLCLLQQTLVFAVDLQPVASAVLPNSRPFANLRDGDGAALDTGNPLSAIRGHTCRRRWPVASRQCEAPRREWRTSNRRLSGCGRFRRRLKQEVLRVLPRKPNGSQGI